MRSTFKLLFYINRQKIKSDGTVPVMCRITIDGKNTAMTTGIVCKADDWNSEKGEIGNVRDNNRLKAYRKQAEKAYDEILKSQGVESAEILKSYLCDNVAIPTTLLMMGEKERERLLIRSKEINSISTYRQSKYFQMYLRDFIVSKGKKDIPFTEITEDFGKEYKAYLKRKKNFSPRQTNMCLCWLNRLMFLAVDYEQLRFNPIEEIEYEKKGAPIHRHISKEELEKMLSMPMQNARMELARRCFLFSTFTGLAYVDTQMLYPHHIGTTANGRKYIRIHRKKTNIEAFIPLHPIAEQILSLYNTTDDTKPVFPLPPRDVMWFEVHELGVAIGKDDNLTYHQARHSFGTLLIGEGIAIESIAKMMGHSNINTTQRYAEVTDRKIAEEMDKLIKLRAEYGLTSPNNINQKSERND